MNESPAAILYDANGVAMAVSGTVAIPSNTRALLVAGTDGTKAQVLSVDSNNRLSVTGAITISSIASSATLPVTGVLGAVGTGTAGTPSSGVVTVQGIANGTVLPVTGAVTISSIAASATLPVTGVLGAVGTGTAGVPSSGVLTVQGITNGTAQPVTGVLGAVGTGIAGTPSSGVVTVQGITNGTSLVVTGVLGAVGTGIAGTPSSGVLTVQGITNGTAQPVTGVLGAIGNKTNNNAAPGTGLIGTLSVLANASSPAWTEGNLVTLSSNLSGALRIDNSSWLGSMSPTVGQKVMASSLPVVIASDQANLTASVVGPVSSSLASTANPIIMGGIDPGTLARSIITDTAGRQVVVGYVSSSANISGINAVNPVIMGGTDGAKARTLLTDTSGREYSVGYVSSSVAMSGINAVNPLIIGGTDGSAARTILTDTSGRIIIAQSSPSNLQAEVGGIDAIFASPTANPVVVGGVDDDGVVRYPPFHIIASGYGGGFGTYSNVTTDLESYRDDFATLLTASIPGTTTFTSGSDIVTGAGTTFTTYVTSEDMYLKLGTAPDSAFTKVKRVDSDTQVTLDSPYPGSTGTDGAIVTEWATVTGAGGGIVAGVSPATTSELAIVSGATSGSATYAYHGTYCAPATFTFYAKLSTRRANQDAIVGLVDSVVNPMQQSCVVFSGTDNTKVSLRTSENGNAVETNTGTLPFGATTAAYHRYRIVTANDCCNLFCDDILIVRNRLHLQNLYQTIPLTIGWNNTGTPAGSTNLFIDALGICNNDILEVESATTTTLTPTQIFGYDNIGTQQQVNVLSSSLLITGPISASAANTYNPIVIGGVDPGTLVRSVITDTAGRLNTVGYVSASVAMSGINAVNPVIMGGTDGTNARTVLTDTTGRLLVAQATAANLNATVAQGTAANLKAQVVGPTTAGDGMANPSTCVITIASLAGIKDSLSTWDRIKSGGLAADTISATSSGSLYTNAYNMGFNGTTWDRLRSTVANGLEVNVTKGAISGTLTHNAVAPIANSLLGVASVLYNGSGPTLTEGKVGLLSANLNGAIRTTSGPGDAGTGTVTSVAAATVTTTLAAATATRIGLTIFNDSTAICYVKFGATASAASYTVKMQAASYYEVPYGYTGVVNAIWASATGAALVTTLS